MVIQTKLIQKKEELVAENGMVVAESPEAARAGVEILENGGNAIDAAVATSFGATACELPMSSLGGGGAALIYLAKEDRVYAIEFEGRLPRAVREDMFKDDLYNGRNRHADKEARQAPDHTPEDQRQQDRNRMQLKAVAQQQRHPRFGLQKIRHRSNCVSEKKGHDERNQHGLGEIKGKRQRRAGDDQQAGK